MFQTPQTRYVYHISYIYIYIYYIIYIYIYTYLCYIDLYIYIYIYTYKFTLQHFKVFKLSASRGPGISTLPGFCRTVQQAKPRPRLGGSGLSCSWGMAVSPGTNRWRSWEWWWNHGKSWVNMEKMRKLCGKYARMFLFLSVYNIIQLDSERIWLCLVGYIPPKVCFKHENDDQSW